ncbi:BMC domain-containing protein [Desulfovibrio legallii]|jgi:microcompartment protein CcmL/EutN|uniref:Carboxysome shell and ethanolamine utilization microcompartment protein CcmL/EutN n=1 Tax=Desulfovibrio legallii TaxID=571438 RepID=A0A1G7JQ48_9BACT|nr:BMC domain-containing protein [Desulfovibrio legallii]SDF27080.1 Carboxysome shell and ethanolamine utilization microcompartment protein CcmL/EutN [Desulfovibrio legallii]
MLALGLVETKGLVGAIEAADVMLKAADVRLLEKSLASGGLVTITVAGEVSAVQSSVDAAQAAVDRLAGAVRISCHVIPRPDGELERILRLQPACAQAESTAKAEDEQNAAPTQEEATPTSEPQPAAEGTAQQPPSAAITPETPPAFDREKTKTMSMSALRRLATELETDLSSAQIAAANRQTLLNAIERATRKEKE